MNSALAVDFTVSSAHATNFDTAMEEPSSSSGNAHKRSNNASQGTSNKKQVQGSRQKTNGQPQRRPYTFDPNIVFSEYTDCPSNSARKGQRLFKHDGVVTTINKTAALNLYFNREHKLPFDVVINHPRPEGSGFAYCQLGIPRQTLVER